MLKLAAAFALLLASTTLSLAGAPPASPGVAQPPQVAMALPGHLPAGRGGALLPRGWLSTRGNQIIDASGTPVRIASIGWSGPDSLDFALRGLHSADYRTIVDSVKAAGFNTLRIPWSDRMLTAFPKPEAINYGLNPDLGGLSALQVIDRVVAYAGQIGLKIILDHHTNEGGLHGWGGQQQNGLWFDLGAGSDGTDGSGNTGTVTAAQFKANTVALARRYAGNATVIGFDLHNEPSVTAAGINWGDGGPLDIRAMYEDVGNAVLDVNPNALIICEGPQNYKSSFAGRGTAPEGDLTLVAERPIRLRAADKLVYSVHEYPTEISGMPNDSGRLAVMRMNRAWGFVVSRNIAPVWVGEMGARMENEGEVAWAQTLLDYMNGKLGALGGPTFTSNQQPISGSWWLVGAAEGEQPNGIQSRWGVGNYRAEQLAVTDRLLYRP